MKPHPPAMRFHDGIADRKAEAHAILLCCRDRIEQTAYQFTLDPRAIVQYADLDARGCGVPPRHDMNLAVRLTRRGDRVDRVVHEIEHDLLQLHPIAMQI